MDVSWLEDMMIEEFNSPLDDLRLDEIASICSPQVKTLKCDPDDFDLDHDKAKFFCANLVEEFFPILCCCRTLTYEVVDGTVFFFPYDVYVGTKGDCVASVSHRIAMLFYFYNMHVSLARRDVFSHAVGANIFLSFPLPPPRRTLAQKGQMKILTDILLAIDNVPKSERTIAVCHASSAQANELGESYKAFIGEFEHVYLYDPLHSHNRDVKMGSTEFSISNFDNWSQIDRTLFISDAYDIASGLVVDSQETAPYFSIKTNTYDKNCYVQMSTACEYRRVSHVRLNRKYAHYGTCEHCVELGYKLQYELSDDHRRLLRDFHNDDRCNLTLKLDYGVKLKKYYDSFLGVCYNTKRGVRPFSGEVSMDVSVRGKDAECDIFMSQRGSLADFQYAQKYDQYLISRPSNIDYEFVAGNLLGDLVISLDALAGIFNISLPAHLSGYDYLSYSRTEHIVDFDRVSFTLSMGNKIFTLVPTGEKLTVPDTARFPHPIFEEIFSLGIHFQVFQGFRCVYRDKSFKSYCDFLYNEFYRMN